jgi:hypothetical protein
MRENRIFTLWYDIGFVYVQTDGQTDGHGETSIPPYNFVVGGILMGNPPTKGQWKELLQIGETSCWLYFCLLACKV